VVYVMDSPVAAADPWFEDVHLVEGFAAHPDGEDCAGHGSSVAGVVAGRSGLVRGAPVVSVAVSCGRLDDRAVLDALEWIATSHPPGTPGVLNVSLALPDHVSFEVAMRGLVERGIVPVLAAGNRGADACSGLVGRVRDVALVVGAVDVGMRRSRSNFGPCVDVFTFGQWVLTTDGRGGVRLLGGTSSAAPRVTGEVVRRLQDEGRPVEQVIAAVVDGAQPAVIHDAGPGSPHRVVQPPSADRHYRTVLSRGEAEP
jgi:subtilisin family serine protease